MKTAIYEVLRKAVKEYWITKKEFYKAVCFLLYKLVENIFAGYLWKIFLQDIFALHS